MTDRCRYRCGTKVYTSVTDIGRPSYMSAEVESTPPYTSVTMSAWHGPMSPPMWRQCPHIGHRCRSAGYHNATPCCSHRWRCRLTAERHRWRCRRDAHTSVPTSVRVCAHRCQCATTSVPMSVRAWLTSAAMQHGPLHIGTDIGLHMVPSHTHVQHIGTDIGTTLADVATDEDGGCYTSVPTSV